MFSLQQNDDFVDHHHPSLISFQQEDHSTPDLHEHVSIVDSKGKSSINYPGSSTRKRGSNKPSLDGGGGGDGEDEKIQKKMVHREIERQRRQEMTKLYASLRELLPLEFIKGNRSISDHMNQAVHYIKQMEENVKGLSAKRDHLKKLSVSNADQISSNNIPNKVSVNFCNGGVEISINSCLIEDGFMLSGVLNSLVEEGLDVTSCTLTKVKDRLFHSIQAEASDLTMIDPSMLQQRLSSVANTQPNIN
ncbi:hypothetical protein L1987_23988 [Smallanthus sonchifolius]|uniref:Uncharacterized protein n=1 Tax=Smallanthus sonchifolius TaxID=185202 RepID=A0ACB9ILU0_9ASTR|nr:hypothetical protein L1987_23988 [Smallanthus sonchifolius]